MSFIKLHFCILILAMLQDGYMHECSDCQIEPTGLLVAVNPDALVGEGLRRSWLCINEEFDKRHIQSQPLSKVNFRLHPMPADGTAIVRVHLQGTTVGESTATSKKVKIISDTLTNFEACQRFFLSMDGVGHDEPRIKVGSAATVKKTDAGKNFLAGAIVKAGIRHSPEMVNKQAEKFAYHQVEKSMHHAVMQMLQQLHQQVTHFSYRNPVLAGLGWQFSSDDRNVYMSAQSNGSYGSSTSMMTGLGSPMPIMVSIDEFFANEYCNSQWAGRTIRSEEVSSWMQQFGNQAPATSPSTDTPAKQWSMTLAHNPIQMRFDSNRIHLTLSLDSFHADDKQLPAARIGLQYALVPHNGRYFLRREEPIDITGDESGARQQIVRSIMRKRLESAVPELIAVPSLPYNPELASRDLDLAIARISLRQQNLTVELDHRKIRSSR